ncbi:acyl carrier protein [Streptomyces sp. GSL17-111]|uniref:acyl carrier protein n=1 Tax=Streptomyces sp. GSL17-111 TaxID=3121596 RepID=UPI0030F41AA8
MDVQQIPSAQEAARQPVTEEAVLEWLVARVALLLDVPAEQVPTDRHLDELDIDSVDAVLLAGELEAWLGQELGQEMLRHRAGLAELGAYLARRYALAPYGIGF